MTRVADRAERMVQFRQRHPGAAFDLKPYLFTARVPGRAEPFRAMSLCQLMDAVERWAAGEMTARLLSGAGPADHGTADDHRAGRLGRQAGPPVIPARCGQRSNGPDARRMYGNDGHLGNDGTDGSEYDAPLPGEDLRRA
jgi:hypothetical protein